MTFISPIIESFTVLDMEVVLKILLSVGLGALVGLERQLVHKPAGLRTNIMVSLGATVFAVTALLFADPARVAAGIVTGIGFLGAGSIIALRGHVHGITTAASLWVVASIGLAVGIGEYALAIMAAVVVFGILRIKSVEEKIESKKKRKQNGWGL